MSRLLSNTFVWTGFLLAVLLALASTEPAFGLGVTCGGGGPVPFQDVTGDFSKSYQYLATDTHVEDFVVAERSDKVFYRDVQGKVSSMPLNGGAPSDLSGVFTSLSKILDPFEKLLTTEAPVRIYSTEEDQFLPGQAKGRPLFWNGQALYSMRSSSKPEDGLFYVSRLSNGKTSPVCQFQIPGAEEATGAEFPYLHFYRTEATPRGYRLFYYRVDIDNCSIDSFVYKGLSAARILAFHRFEKIQSSLVEFADPQANLMWEDATGCRYFNIEADQILPLRQDRPVIAAFKQHESIHLVYLDTRQSVQLWHWPALQGIKATDLWLSPTGSTLIVNPHLSGYQGEGLVKIDLYREN